MMLPKTLLRPSATCRISPSLRRRWMTSVINLSDEEAVEKFRSINTKSLLYFTASWCGPCKMIKPIYEQMAKDYPGVAFGKVDVDDNPDAAMKHQISAVPTFISFLGETSVNQFSGADPNQLKTIVEDLLKK